MRSATYNARTVPVAETDGDFMDMPGSFPVGNKAYKYTVPEGLGMESLPSSGMDMHGLNKSDLLSSVYMKKSMALAMAFVPVPWKVSVVFSHAVGLTAAPSLLMKSLLPLLFGIALPSMALSDTLKSQLEERQKAFSTKTDETTKKDYAEGIEAVEKSGILKEAVQVGQQAPDFALKNSLGETVQLSTLLRNGPVVLTWYRGGWCPYCNLTLAALQQSLPDIQAAGGQLVALTPELPDKSLTTVEKQALKFPVLTDLNHETAKRYKVAFNLTPEVAARYKKQFNLQDYNGKEAGDILLPLAATYIIDSSGVVRYAFLDADYRKRAEPAEIVAFLQKMKAEAGSSTK